MKRWRFVSLILALFPLICNAEDVLKARAEAAWAAREDVNQALLAIELYEELAAQDPNDFESRVRLARVAYWAITEMEADLEKSKKIEMYENAIRRLNEIIERDEDNVPAWYWLVWDMGALTMVEGVFSGWNLREGIIGTIMVSKADVNFHYGGVYRYWGRVIYETPGLMGRFLHFTDEDSIWIYKRAIAVEPNYIRNHFYLAETYQKLGRKEDARKEYEFCVKIPDDALPEIVPETRFYKRLATERLERM
jgi:tetratricopeptide (TPR) repeat protein